MLIDADEEDWDLQLAMTEGLRKQTQEGRQYSKWHVFMRSGLRDLRSAFPCDESDEVPSWVGYSFFTSHPHFQLPVISTMSSWADESILKGIDLDSLTGKVRHYIFLPLNTLSSRSI